VVLANILRTDRAVHRSLPADSELVRAIAVLARAQQDAVWDRTQAHHKLRSLLREYYPGFLAAFGDLRGGILRPEARVLLAAAPTPADAARLTHPSWSSGCAGPAASVACPPTLPACTRPSPLPTCTSRRWSSRRWADTPWPC
jgi:Transposase